MSDQKVDFKNLNAIAYDGDLRDQLKLLHEMLGVEVTDVANSAIEASYKFQGNAQNVLSYLSKMASKLSIALINAKKSVRALSDEEKRDYENIKSLTATIGNLQDKLLRIMKLGKEVNILNEQIQEIGMDFSVQIADAQEEFRGVRSSINAYGFLSKNPELSNLFESQKEHNK